MLNAQANHHAGSGPIKTLIAVVGIAIGIIFFLQVYNIIPFSFDMTNPMYLKIFACYAVISGIALIIHLPTHGTIRY